MSAPEFPPIDAMRNELAEALATNEIVRLGETMLLVPDVMMLEALANGRDIPPTQSVERQPDGRVVYLYRGRP
jgi:hypothetical protein